MIKNCVGRKDELGHQALMSESQVTGYIFTLPLTCYLVGKSQKGMMGLEAIIKSQMSNWRDDVFQKSGFCRQQQ